VVKVEMQIMETHNHSKRAGSVLKPIGRNLEDSQSRILWACKKRRRRWGL